MRNARALVVAGLVLTAPSAGPAATLDDVVRDLEGTYSRMIDLRAEFTQTAFNKSLNQTIPARSEEHTSELQSRLHLVCRLLLEKKKKVQLRPSDGSTKHAHKQTH